MLHDTDAIQHVLPQKSVRAQEEGCRSLAVPEPILDNFLRPLDYARLVRPEMKIEIEVTARLP